MTSKDHGPTGDADGPEGASGSRWEPTDGASEDASHDAEATAEHPTLADQGARTRWRPSRTLGLAAVAALAGLVVGGVGGWAAGSHGNHDDRRMNPSMVGIQHDGDGRMPGGPGGMPPGGQFGGPGGPGVVPGQPQLGQDDDSDDGSGSGDSSDDGQQS